jgi:hypothetical protein
MVYWIVARRALAGDLAPLGDPVALTALINQHFRDWLSSELPPHPWLYPPHFLLLLLPFGALPFALSYALFQLGSAGAALAALAGWLGPPRRSWPFLLALVLAPAAAVNAVCGQNAFLVLALLLGGIGLLGRAELVGGALLGLLSLKPQFAPLALVALLALGRWRALGAALCAGGIAVAASAAVLGSGVWLDWIGALLGGHALGGAEWREWGRLWGLSVWTCARLLGASARLAELAQGGAALLAAAGVWLAFRRELSRERRMAVLLAATLLAAPHSEPYDLLLLAAAVLLLVAERPHAALPPVPPLLLVLPWSAPLLSVPRLGPAGFALPPLLLGVMALALFPSRGRALAAT